jgi:hypothetical protein
MTPPTVVPTSVTFAVDWVHLREAERQAAGNASSRCSVLSPVLLALQEQSRFANGEFTDDGVVLVDAHSRRKIRYAHNPALRAYLAAWVMGQPLEPASFTLELPE